MVVFLICFFLNPDDYYDDDFYYFDNFDLDKAIDNVSKINDKITKVLEEHNYAAGSIIERKIRFEVTDGLKNRIEFGICEGFTNEFFIKYRFKAQNDNIAEELNLELLRDIIAVAAEKPLTLEKIEDFCKILRK